MPATEASKRRAAEYRAQLLRDTVCAECGAQPIEWHHRIPQGPGDKPVSTLIVQGASRARIDREIAKCDPLCRSCHMRRDGRAAALSAARPFKCGDKQPPKLCEKCGIPANPLRRGYCPSCDKARRKYGDAAGTAPAVVD